MFHSVIIDDHPTSPPATPGKPPFLTEGAMSHFVIIDGHHLMYRAYWAIPRTLVTTKGEQVNAVFGVASMILQILKTEQPDRLLFCFDAGEETFRHKEFAGYKGGRAETPDDFYAQVPRILELVGIFGFKYVAQGGYEADDFACTYARAASAIGDRVTVVSGDRDLLQLTTDSVRIAVPAKGYQAPEYFGPQEVEKKYGVTPAQIPSYKGLVGDASDNLKGVTGIGPVAAAALLKQFGTLEHLYAHLDQIKKPLLRRKLEAGREQAFFCQRMASLLCDIPLPLPLSSLTVGTLDAERILGAFGALEFATLGRRLIALQHTPYGTQHFPSPPRTSDESAQQLSTQREAADEAAQLSLL